MKDIEDEYGIEKVKDDAAEEKKKEKEAPKQVRKLDW